MGRLNRADSENNGFGIRLQGRWNNKYKISGKYRPEVEGTIEVQGLWNQIVVAMVQVSWVRKVKHPVPAPRFELVSVAATEVEDMEAD